MLTLVVLTLLGASVSATVVNEGKEIFCARANITGVRIEGCAKEPCRLPKGTKLPVEIDFSFQTPKSAEEINFQVFAPYWNVPGTGAYGSNLASGTQCSKLGLAECPAFAGTKYTLKSALYADPKLEKTTGNKEKTGRVRTGWRLMPNDRNTQGSEGYSVCSFNVLIDICN